MENWENFGYPDLQYKHYHSGHIQKVQQNVHQMNYHSTL